MKDVLLLTLLVFLTNSSLAIAEDVLVPDERLYPVIDLAVEHGIDGEVVSIQRTMELSPENHNIRSGKCGLIVSMKRNKLTNEWNEIYLGVVLQSTVSVSDGVLDDKEDNKGIIRINGERTPCTFFYTLEELNRIHSEFYLMSMTPAELMTLGSAKVLSFQGGNLIVKFDDGEREFLRSFAAHIPRGKVGQFNVKTDPMSEQKANEEEKKAEEEKMAEEMAQLERRASSSLRVIKKAFVGKDDQEAIRKLKELVARYPGTAAAKEAKALLVNISVKRKQ